MPQHSTRVTALLFEAYRRKEMLTKDAHWQGEPLERWWVGLGTAAAYRPAIRAGLMRFHDDRPPSPRCMGWLCLTPAGIVALAHHEDLFARRLSDLKSRPEYQWSFVSQYQLAGGLTR
jgi:hypothetical protein